MGITLKSILRKHRMKHLVELEMRPRKLGKLAGFVMHITDDMILLHGLEKDGFRLNGYYVVCQKMVGRYRVFSKPEYWQFRAIEHFRIKPKQPRGISLQSLPILLRSIAENYPLITIHREKIDSEVCFIGRLKNMAGTSFTLEDLDCNAEWSGPRRIKFNDVTRVDFGGGYESALAATAPTFI